MTLLVWRLLGLAVTALSLGLSFAHLLEAPPRLRWPPALWREVTVFNGQFEFFALVGAPLDIAAVLVTTTLVMAVWNRRPPVWFALVAAIAFAFSLIAWLTLVAPANEILATWKPGPIPADFEEVRKRWETGHMVIATLKAVGFVAVALSVLVPRTGRSSA